jgi:hypothetical protein
MKARLALIGLLAAAVTVIAAPTTAQAAPATPGTLSAGQAAAPAVGKAAVASKASVARVAAADGYFYVWNDINAGGQQCRWFGDSSNWGGCRNKASSMENNGYAGSYEDVRFYWDAGYGGANDCLWNGYYVPNLAAFAFPNNGSGGGENLNDNISSHKWANC